MRILLLIAFACSTMLAQLDAFVSLMPDKDVTELWIVEGSAPGTWRVEDGIIRCTGKPNGFLRSKKIYKNFVLKAEWRFQAEGWTAPPPKFPNAGFFINAGAIEKTWPKSHEVQGHFGEAGSLFGVRGAVITGSKRGPIVPNRPPLGSWDRYEITQQDGRVRVLLNGDFVNEGWDADPSEGNICIQSEGWPVDYRNIQIKEIK